MQRLIRLSMCLSMLLLCASCSDSTSPVPAPSTQAIAASEIDRMVVFARNRTGDYVEIDFTRRATGSTLVVFRPPQPGFPRFVLDSIGPVAEDPEEITELLDGFNVWAMADSNAAGAACNTRSGSWVCDITFDDYSVVLAVWGRGTMRSQRYTRLGESGSNPTAKALGDFAFAMMRRRQGSSSTTAARGM